jgi:formylglycine-generating enzyme required for sulfatase activity
MFAHRYRESMLRALQMRRTYLLTDRTDLDPPLFHYVCLELGRTIEDAPDIWCYLRETSTRQNPGGVKNFERWLYQRDGEHCRTIPADPVNIEKQNDHQMDFTARRTDVASGNSFIGFAVDDRFLSAGPSRVAFKITYRDEGNASWELDFRQQENMAGKQPSVIRCDGTGKVRTATFLRDGVVFNARGLDPDFAIRALRGDSVIKFVRVVRLSVEDRLGELITIPAGGFLMGNSGQEGYGSPEEFPQHRVDLPAYQIGKYEVTRGQYRKFIEAGGYEDSRYWSSEGWKWKESNGLIYAGMNGRFNRAARPGNPGPRRAPERWDAGQEWIGHGHAHPRFTQTDQHPVVGVTYYEAEAYCKWAGGRLPTEAEWEKAARWDEKQQHARVWPWGDTWDPENCNNPADHNPASGGFKVNQSAPVGSYPAGASHYGGLDMVGNAWEWVASRSQSHPGNPKPYDHGDAYRLVKGGCWDDGPSSSARCSYRTWYLPLGGSGPAPSDCDFIGFRVAR